MRHSWGPSTGLRTLLFLSLLYVIMPAFSLTAASDNGIITPESGFFVPATRQPISEPVLRYWTENDGATRLGMPVSDQIEVKSGAIQYFELGALKISDSGDMERTEVGRDLVAMRYGPEVSGRSSHKSAFARLDSIPSGESVLFDEETGHAIKGRFAAAYSELGGVESLGRPLSEAYQIGNVRTQWFEFGRLVTTGKKVVLASTGQHLAARLRISMEPQERSDRRAVYLDRYQALSSDAIENQMSVFAPARISIPAIGVDAHIEDVPIIDGVMQTPQDVWAVGWYYDLPAPGQYSNVVMAGHRDWWDVGAVVFYDIGSLAAGDEIYVTAVDGHGATYQVTGVQIVDAEINAAEVVRDAGADTLTLITCGGDFDGEHYLSRVIIQSERV